MTNKLRVYIAAPYTFPDPCINTNKVMNVANHLMNLGYYPYIPHLTHFQHTFFPRPEKDWYKLDKEFLKVCDVVLRLKGKSKGADEEVKLAKQLGIPVVTTIEQLKKIKKGGTNENKT